MSEINLLQTLRVCNEICAFLVATNTIDNSSVPTDLQDSLQISFTKNNYSYDERDF
jgi:hypothetical protein